MDTTIRKAYIQPTTNVLPTMYNFFVFSYNFCRIFVQLPNFFVLLFVWITQLFIQPLFIKYYFCPTFTPKCTKIVLPKCIKCTTKVLFLYNFSAILYNIRLKCKEFNKLFFEPTKLFFFFKVATPLNNGIFCCATLIMK